MSNGCPSSNTPSDQMKDFQATSQKSAETVAKPMKDVFEKTVKELRVA